MTNYIKTDAALTKLAKAGATGKREFFSVGVDSPLVIRLEVSGKISFIVWYESKQHIVAKYPAVDMEGAKTLAGAKLLELMTLPLPADEDDTKAEMTVNDVADLYSKILSRNKKDDTAAQALLAIITASIGTEKMRGIDTLTLHKPIAAYIKKEQHAKAAKVLSALRSFMAYATEMDIVDKVYPLTAKFAGVEKLSARERHLSRDEIHVFFTALDENKTIDKRYKLFSKILLSTCLRSSEIRLTRWENVDLEGREMIITKDLLKTGTSDFVVPLTDLTVDLLTQLKALTGEHELLLGGANANSLPAIFKRFQKKIGFAEFVPHDLRRSARSLLGDLGVLDEIAERCLCHKTAGIQKVYDYSARVNERRQALTLYNDSLLDSIK